MTARKKFAHFVKVHRKTGVAGVGPGSYAAPASRPLAVYAFDPSFGRKLNNFMTIQVPFEPLQEGPVGRKLAVIDYDISNGCYYEAVDLNNPFVMLDRGLEPTESDPRFHQQMVYAVASETVRRFEYGLGREIKWRPSSLRRNRRHGDRLRLFPHAFQQANAYYDPKQRAVFFGYFAASQDAAGNNIPNQVVFTCLSHDIIAHEVTHALIDGMRLHYTEPTNADAPAFHEAFSDIVALFQHFSMRDAVIDTIRRTGGLLYRQILQAVVDSDQPVIAAELNESNPLVELARQFGEAMGMRKALRSALGTRPDPKLLEATTEPHLRGAILVAAVFDAYFSIYVKRTRDLMRIAGIGPALNNRVELSAELAEKLTREAGKAASHVLNMCIRALDYCPPVDIRLGEFLRAIITADWDLVPNDPWGYRAEFITAFRMRGIVPEKVASYSEESLRWASPADLGRGLKPCNGLTFDMFRESSASDLEANRLKDKANYFRLLAYANDRQVTAALGLMPFQKPGDPKIAIGSFRPLHRVGPNGELVINFVVEYLQQRAVPEDPQEKRGGRKFIFRGGSTVIFDHRGRVRYALHKRIGSTTRLRDQRAFRAQIGEHSSLAVYRPNGGASLSFASIHRGC